MTDAHDTLLDLLRVEPLEVDLFRGTGQGGETSTRIFGGQVIGQAIGPVPRIAPVTAMATARAPLTGPRAAEIVPRAAAIAPRAAVTAQRAAETAQRQRTGVAAVAIVAVP